LAPNPAPQRAPSSLHAGWPGPPHGQKRRRPHLLEARRAAALDARLNRVQAQLGVRQVARALGGLRGAAAARVAGHGPGGGRCWAAQEVQTRGAAACAAGCHGQRRPLVGPAMAPPKTSAHAHLGARELDHCHRLAKRLAPAGAPPPSPRKATPPPTARPHPHPTPPGPTSARANWIIATASPSGSSLSVRVRLKLRGCAPAAMSSASCLAVCGGAGCRRAGEGGGVVGAPPSPGPAASAACRPPRESQTLGTRTPPPPAHLQQLVLGGERVDEAQLGGGLGLYRRRREHHLHRLLQPHEARQALGAGQGKAGRGVGEGCAALAAGRAAARASAPSESNQAHSSASTCPRFATPTWVPPKPGMIPSCSSGRPMRVPGTATRALQPMATFGVGVGGQGRGLSAWRAGRRGGPSWLVQKARAACCLISPPRRREANSRPRAPPHLEPAAEGDAAHGGDRRLAAALEHLADRIVDLMRHWRWVGPEGDGAKAGVSLRGCGRGARVPRGPAADAPPRRRRNPRLHAPLTTPARASPAPTPPQPTRLGPHLVVDAAAAGGRDKLINIEAGRKVGAGPGDDDGLDRGVGVRRGGVLEQRAQDCGARGGGGGARGGGGGARGRGRVRGRGGVAAARGARRGGAGRRAAAPPLPPPPPGGLGAAPQAGRGRRRGGTRRRGGGGRRHTPRRAPLTRTPRRRRRRAGPGRGGRATRALPGRSRGAHRRGAAR
jgi:hypothetical protein